MKSWRTRPGNCPGQTHLSSPRRNFPEPLLISILGSWPPGLQNNKVLLFKTLTGRVKEGGQCWYVIHFRVSAHNCQVCFDGELSSSTGMCWAEAVSPSFTPPHSPERRSHRVHHATSIYLITEELCGFQSSLDVFEKERAL